jgi:hypothetical protein
VERYADWMDRLRQASKRQTRLHHNRTPEDLSWTLSFCIPMRHLLVRHALRDLTLPKRLVSVPSHQTSP